MKTFSRMTLMLLASTLAGGQLASCQAVDQLLVGVSGVEGTLRPDAQRANTNLPDDLQQTSEAFSQPDADRPTEPLLFPAEHPVPFSARHDTYLQRWNGDAYEDFYIKGVNLGVGLPGTQAGDLAATRQQYAQWFAQMHAMGFNNLRIYTLHFPRFYEELARFNAAHPDDPLYVFHGAWLEEGEGIHDLYEETENFQAGMREVVDAIHGNVEIGQRRGRAYGTYTADISRWVAGWIIGREVAPEEVISTNEKHAQNTRYEGKNLAITGNPTEVWWAEQVDYLVEHERNNYKVDRPISVSSWPTLDPLTHPTENPEETMEDVVSFDFAQLEMKNMPAGYFPSFHAYPYYPNFIINDPDYNQVRDAEGVNNYLGYIKDLKAHYKDMPLVIGEYGTSSSWGNAHFSPSGIDHGGLTEREQMAGNARLTRDLHEAQTAGGMVFAWIDEWWKRTWIVDERTLPRERYRLWHNLTSPEENFGLVAFELPEVRYQEMARSEQAVRKVETYADAAYFRVRLTLDEPPGEQSLVVGFDTYADDLGDTVLPGGIRTQRRNEFALTLNATNQARLMVTQAYDLYGIWHNTSGPLQLFQSTATQGKGWVVERWQNGQRTTSRDGSMVFPATSFEIGQLSLQQSGEPFESHDAVTINGTQVELRLPWVMLQFTDPSTRSVMHDNRKTAGRETRTSDGIALSVAFKDTLIETQRYTWPTWDQPPEVTQRFKAGVDTLAATLNQLPD